MLTLSLCEFLSAYSIGCECPESTFPYETFLQHNTEPRKSAELGVLLCHTAPFFPKRLDAQCECVGYRYADGRAKGAPVKPPERHTRRCRQSMHVNFCFFSVARCFFSLFLYRPGLATLSVPADSWSVPSSCVLLVSRLCQVHQHLKGKKIATERLNRQKR